MTPVKVAAVMAVAALAVTSVPPHRFQATPATDQVLVERAAYLMGTRVRLLTWDPSRRDGLARLDAALTALEQTEAELSTWRDESAITSLNRSPIGAPWPAPPAVCEMFATLSAWHAQTDGAFDPAIGRLIEAWDVHGDGHIPSAQELVRARASSGLRLLDVDGAGCLVIRRADVTVDVGGFGKGEGLDRAAHVLGDRPWMVDFGGQVSVHGSPPEMNGWPVAIAHPMDRSRPYLNVTMREGSLSTSAGFERDLMVDGQRVSHILDPRMGKPAAFRGSVTVWHRRALDADILSTALYVMGPDDGIRWAEPRGVSACFMVPDNSGKVRMATTTAFRESVYLQSRSRNVAPTEALR